MDILNTYKQARLKRLQVSLAKVTAALQYWTRRSGDRTPTEAFGRMMCRLEVKRAAIEARLALIERDKPHEDKFFVETEHTV